MKKNKNINLIVIVCTAIVLFISSCKKEDEVMPQHSESNNESAEKAMPSPVVPPILEVPVGNKVRMHWYAQGFQIYKCLPDPLNPGLYLWTFQSPLADLYSCSNYITIVGSHFAGPTWSNNHG